jgi:hypothetical protein
MFKNLFEAPLRALGVEQPFIEHLLWNAATFGRRVVQWWFADDDALARENTRIWERYYRPMAMYDPWPAWEAWMPEYRRLIVEVQEIAGETGRGRLLSRRRPRVPTV